MEQIFLKQIYDENIFKKMLQELAEEYREDGRFTEERISSEFEQLKNKELYLWCLIDMKNDILGYITVRKDYQITHTADVVNVIICKNNRGQGFGKKMLFLFEEEMKRKKVKQIVLGARRSKEGFYLSCGYVGEGMLQCDVNKGSKEEMEQLLLKNKINITNYKLWENKVHQFRFDAKEILTNESFTNLIEQDKKFNLVVVFTKNI